MTIPCNISPTYKNLLQFWDPRLRVLKAEKASLPPSTPLSVIPLFLWLSCDTWLICVLLDSGGLFLCEEKTCALNDLWLRALWVWVSLCAFVCLGMSACVLTGMFAALLHHETSEISNEDQHEHSKLEEARLFMETNNVDWSNIMETLTGVKGL